MPVPPGQRQARSGDEGYGWLRKRLSYLFELGLVQNGCGVEVQLLLPAAGQQGAFLVHVGQVRIHPGHQCCFHHRPVLGILIHVSDIAAAVSPHET